MKTWRLVIDPPSRGSWNMAVDESILEHVGGGGSPPTLRLYAWNPPCLSLGHAQSFADVDIDALRSKGWEVVRRLTGGRAILHTDELTYSVSGGIEEPILAGGILESYNRIAVALMSCAREIGLPVEMSEGRASAKSGTINPICFEVPSTHEITVEGKKLIGSAQARRKEGVLQHGSLPLSGDLTRICQALVFESEELRGRASRRLTERATTAETVLGRAVTWDEAAAALVAAFQSQLGLVFERANLTSSELERAQELLDTKYAHPSWTSRT